MKTIAWRHEPKGPGNAYHTFLDAGGTRVEILTYDCQTNNGGQRMCGFEVYGRLRKGGSFWDQLAAGEASNLDEAMSAGLAMVAKPRDQWAILPRSWVA